MPNPTPNPPHTEARPQTPAKSVDAGGLPADAAQTVAHPEPERETATPPNEKPATGITPSGAAGGRRM